MEAEKPYTTNIRIKPNEKAREFNKSVIFLLSLYEFRPVKYAMYVGTMGKKHDAKKLTTPPANAHSGLIFV
ncbi:hypothetical protein LDC_1004 [sediment metagenome]|uniref:Uncharacterized protein n=1 Tax=sediment metagenome TaxID=749907 RepID=D9PHK4_9ZZZZ